MGRPRKKRRQSHGSAWHWRQTDCWYYTLSGTKRRVALFGDEGQRIRGDDNRELATHCGVIAIVQAAFNRGEEYFDVANPLKGLKRPTAQPRLQSLSPEDEKTLYGATEECFRNFLFAAIHSGLRPFCELAKIT